MSFTGHKKISPYRRREAPKFQATGFDAEVKELLQNLQLQLGNLRGLKHDH